MTEQEFDEIIEPTIVAALEAGLDTQSISKVLLKNILCLAKAQHHATLQEARVSRDPIALPPICAGSNGQAWLIDHESYMKIDATPHTTLRAWLVEAPQAHPYWHSYFVGVIHLRSKEGIQPAVIRRPGATHEVMVLALNPEHPRQPMIEGKCAPFFLMPVNFIGQFHANTDDEAILHVFEDVQAICRGQLNPDTDALQQWIERYGAYMLTKCK